MIGRKEQSCPSHETLVRVFQGDMSLSRRTQVYRHVVECPECARKLELLQSLRHELKDKVDDLARSLEKDALANESQSSGRLRRRTGHSHHVDSGKSRFGGPAWKFAAGTAALLALFSAGYLLWNSINRESGIRSAGSTGLTLLHPLGNIAEPPVYLEWTSIRNADIYNVRLTDADLRVIFEDSLQTTRYLIPDDRIKKLRRGVSYAWAVTAYDDDINILDVKSGTFTITLPRR